MTDTMLRTIWAIESGETDPASPLAAARARAAAAEPWLRAFCHIPDRHAEGPAGPLAGIPVGVKDIMATADMPTTNGSPIHAGAIPGADAWIVARLRALGGIVFGKTVSTEFAWRHPGPTVNPWDRARTPGGSSSGSAAAVAAGIVPLALGTQTFGSIIRPAAFCGVVGYKPSYGAIPAAGVHPLAASLDHVGFFARRAADAAAAHALFIAGEPEAVRDPARWEAHFRPLAAPPRLGVLRTGFWEDAQAAQRETFEAALATLAGGGAIAEHVDLPMDIAALLGACTDILAHEAAHHHLGGYLETHPALVSAPLRQLIAEGRAVGAARYGEALAQQRAWRAAFGEWAAAFDAILTLPATGEAPLGLGYTGDARFCAPWTLLGIPAITIPAGRSAGGMPLGLQLLAPFGADAVLLRAADWAERTLALPPRGA